MRNARITAWLLMATAAVLWIPPTEAQEQRVRRGGKRVIPGLNQPIAQRLTDSEAERSDQFGWSVAIRGNRLAVGAILAGDSEDDAHFNAGKVVIFSRNSNGIWVQKKILPNPTPERRGYFGLILALSDTHLFVGVPDATIDGVSGAGAVYVYSWNDDTVDERPQIISLEEPAEDARFGISLAVDGETAIIGAYRAGENEDGVAFVYGFDGSGWSEQDQLNPSDWLSGMGFAARSAMSGDWLVIGAPGDFGGSQNEIWGAGSAYVFRREGESWIQHQKLTAPEPEWWNGFGFPVAISGGTILISALGEDDGDFADAGAVYVFVESSGTWEQKVKLNRPIPSDGVQWGWATAISGDTVTIGLPNTPESDPPNAGVVDIYTRKNNMWTFGRRMASPQPFSFGSFGYSLALSGPDLLIGAHMEDAPGNVWDAGAAYVYTLSSLNKNVIRSRATIETERTNCSHEQGGE